MREVLALFAYLIVQAGFLADRVILEASAWGPGEWFVAILFGVAIPWALIYARSR